MTRLLKESFVPVLLVIGAIFVIIFYSNYIADIDADQATIIEIPSNTVQQGDEQELIVDEESFTQVEKLRIDEPVFIDAYLLIKNKQWQKAENAYLALIKQNESSQARTDLGYIYYKQGAYDKAITEFTKALKKQPVYIAAYYYRAKAWGKLLNFELSALDYLAYIKYFPVDYSAHFNLAMVRFKQQQYAAAVKLFKTASELSPGRKKSKALYFLGKSYQKSGEDYIDQARESYLGSIRVFPGNIKPRMGMASLLPDNEQGMAEAVEIYLQVLQLKQNHAPAYFYLAGIYSDQGKQRDAMMAYNRAIEFNPSYVSARFNLGLILLEKKKWREAADQFQAIVNISPEHARAYFNLGRANYRLKYFDQALSNYQAALDLKKGDYPEVILNLGLVYSAKKEFKKAISVYESALQKHKDSEKLYYNIGIAYSKSDNYEQALDAFQSAIQYRPAYAQAWYNIALIYSRQEQHEKAADAYGMALQFKPEYRSAQLNLAVSLARTGKLKDAEAVYRQVLEAHPRYASAWINLGLVLIDQQRFSDAEEVLIQASLLEIDNERVIGLLAKALASQEKYTEATGYYRTVLDISPDSKKYRLEYVRVLIQSGELEVALVEVNKAINLHPKSKLLKKEFDQINLKLKLKPKGM